MLAVITWDMILHAVAEPYFWGSRKLGSTRVYSWNTYFTRLFVMNMLPDPPDQFRVRLWFSMHVVDLLIVYTTCDFERGGAKKLIIGSSWNNSKKNHLDLCQVQKCSNMIPLVWFSLSMALNALAILHEAFLNIVFCQNTLTHNTHTDMTALHYPAAHALVHGNNGCFYKEVRLHMNLITFIQHFASLHVTLTTLTTVWLPCL